MTNLTNIIKNYEIILASQSPRRINLLKSLNIDFKVEPAYINENICKKISPNRYVQTLASKKAEAVAAKYKETSKIIIGADTIVVLNNQIINKPNTEIEAFKMLKSLSGRYHFVYTGIALANTQTGKIKTDFSRTCVHFRKLQNEEILEYVADGKTLDKAGSYGIQDDYGALFVKKIEGCYNNVIGLPLELLWQNFSDIFI